MKHLWKSGFLALCLALICLLAACGGQTESPDTSDAPNAPDSTSTAPVHTHSFGQWQTVKQADCTQEGLQERSCTCGEKETQPIEARGHQEAVKTGTQPTCTEPGLSDGKYCSVCNTVQEEQTQIPALGHDEVADQAVAATCTKTGLTEGKHCGRCQSVLVKQEEVAVKGHDFADYVFDKDATCTKNGTETAKCSRCDQTDSREAKNSATGHTEVVDPGVEPSCTIPGLTDGKRCSVCGEVTVKQQLARAKGHAYENGFCTRCGVQEIKTSFGLTFLLNEDGNSYRVAGLGACTDKNIVVPEIFNGLPVTAVADGAFSDCTSLTGITLQSGVTSIGKEAFINCYSLTNITLPDGLEHIGASAFENCGGLQNVRIPRSLKSIDKGAFFFCHGLKGVYITDLSAWCVISFEGVGANPLAVASNLYVDGRLVTDLVIPAEVEKISDYAFAQCAGLKSVTIGKQTTTIGNNAFYYCTDLAELTLEEGVATIGKSAFEGCGELKAISIPASVKTIGANALTQCGALETITVHKNNKNFGSAGNCLIDTQNKILLRGCDTSVIPGDGSVTTIASGAFSGCLKMESITIPKTVKHIEKYAFNHCLALTEVVYEGSQTRWDAVTKEESWIWYVGAYTVECLGRDTDLVLTTNDFTLSPKNGISQDLFQLIQDNGEFDRSLLICTSADESVVRIEGTKVIAVGNKNTGVTVTITYGSQSVTCLVRTSGITSYSLNKTDVKLILGKSGSDSFELKLLDAAGKPVKDVQWKYSNDFPKCCDKVEDAASGTVKITAKAITTDLSNGAYVKVVTTYQGQKYECIVRVVAE